MTLNDLDLEVPKLGECRITSPMSSPDFVDDGERVLFDSTLRDAEAFLQKGRKLQCFEMAGPREKIYFDPSKLKCGLSRAGVSAQV